MITPTSPSKAGGCTGVHGPMGTACFSHCTFPVGSDGARCRLCYGRSSHPAARQRRAAGGMWPPLWQERSCCGLFVSSQRRTGRGRGPLGHLYGGESCCPCGMAPLSLHTVGSPLAGSLQDHGGPSELPTLVSCPAADCGLYFCFHQHDGGPLFAAPWSTREPDLDRCARHGSAADC